MAFNRKLIAFIYTLRFHEPIFITASVELFGLLIMWSTVLWSDLMEATKLALSYQQDSIDSSCRQSDINRHVDS